MRRAFGFAAVGLFAGIVLSIWLAPRLVGWWYRPSASSAQLCAESVRLVMAGLVAAQVGICTVAALLGLVLGLVLRRRRRPAAAVPPTPAA